MIMKVITLTNTMATMDIIINSELKHNLFNSKM